MPRRWTLRNSMRSYYTPFQALGRDKPTYRDGISRGGPTMTHATCLNACKSQKRYTKEDHLLKIISGHQPTVPVLTGENGRGAASPSNPEKGRSGKRKINDAGHPSNAPTGAKKTCILHGPGHSTEDCKVLQYSSKNHIAQ